jgi:hypothetical protein
MPGINLIFLAAAESFFAASLIESCLSESLCSESRCNESALFGFIINTRVESLTESIFLTEAFAPESLSVAAFFFIWFA